MTVGERPSMASAFVCQLRPSLDKPSVHDVPAVSAASGLPSELPAGFEPDPEVQSQALEGARRWLYSQQDLPGSYLQWLGGVHAEAADPPPLSFLDHAWGSVAPRVLEAGFRGLVGAAVAGNAAWDDVFGRLMPKASEHVLSLLGLAPRAGEEAPTVHWGHNSHELVWRALSSMMDGRGSPLVILTSDTEFYSLTRQLNRLTEQRSEAGSSLNGLAVTVEVVPVEPASTFGARLLRTAEDKKPDVVYCSQIDYLTQQTLLPDVSTLVSELADILSAQRAAPSRQAPAASHPPVILVDGYHGFCALPTCLEGMFNCRPVACGAVVVGYVAGLLKHAGCMPSAAFMVTSSGWSPRPLMTGWLADPSVLHPQSCGIKMGSQVGYAPGLELQGGTPGYILPLYCFTHLMDCWANPKQLPAPDQPTNNSHIQINNLHSRSNGTQEPSVPATATPTTLKPPSAKITVQAVHQHVIQLQRRFLAGLETAAAETGSEPLLPLHRLVNLGVSGASGVAGQAERNRSHTLVFKFDSSEQAASIVARLADCGVAVDTRKGCVRVGFGFNHSLGEVQQLINACRQSQTAAEACK